MMGQAGRHGALRLMDFSAQWKRLLNEELYDLYSSPNTAELHSSVLIGKESHSHMWKIRIGGFLFENGIY